MRKIIVIIGIFVLSAFCWSGCGVSESNNDKTDGDITENESDGDAEETSSLPDKLNLTFTREDKGTPVTAEEVTQFTKKVMALYKNINYFDYVLYTTHGVDKSTGKKDWQFWYSENFKKEGKKVTFYHAVNLNDGGHNLHIPMSRALGNVISAYLLTDDAKAGLAAQQLCKGMSASMLGMVYDENDKINYLMARNIAAFNHEFLTHDGKQKAVDYSGWYSSYTRWNCDRFPYENNPYWGKLWITNMRSKDDVPHIFTLLPVLRYAAEKSKNADVKEACGEALGLLEKFAKAIVEADYRIQTKDKDGKIYIPGYTEDPELNKKQGDLASFIEYRDFIPNGECNARASAELIGYHSYVNEDCGRGEPNNYDKLSFKINSYNKAIVNFFHTAHLGNAVVNGQWDRAALLLDGLNERIAADEATPEADYQASYADWWRNLATHLAYSNAYGFPLISDDVRLIHKYFSQAVDEFESWPYWDPWADTVPDGELGGYHPANCKGDGNAECWFRVEDIGLVFRACWTPFANPSSKSWVDCSIVKDPSKW